MKNNSLRFIKKEATAQALANAAFELAMEKGLDGFVVEDVVQRAGYSRRTFANHYSCKEEGEDRLRQAVVFYRKLDRDSGDCSRRAGREWDTAWWLPKWMDRMLPNLDVEGDKLIAELKAQEEAEANVEAVLEPQPTH